MSKKQQSRRQKQMRRRRDETAFLFDQDLTQVLGEVSRESWECAISVEGGDVEAAARFAGLDGIPKSAKALWGRSAQAALETYRAWQNRKAKLKKKAQRR